MPNYQPITLESHGKKRWQRYSAYAFAANETVIPLTTVELPKAIMSLPIAFIEQAGSFTPVAVLGLQTGNNVFVAPNGSWTGQYYIPAAFRSFPFCLANTLDGQQVMCIDEDSGLLTDGPSGEAFFAEEGQPSQAILDVLNFLKQIGQSRLSTVTACAALQKHALLRPWPITVKTEAGEKQIAGLFQIDEAALNLLASDALLELRQAGALSLAYCQLLSMQHLPVLGQLAEAKAKVAQDRELNAALNLEFFSNNGTINFGVLI